MNAKLPDTDASRDCARLFEICNRWSARLRPSGFDLSSLVGFRLPKARYLASRPYNGFTPAERELKSRVVRLLRKEGVIPTPTRCDVREAVKRIGFHSENYYALFRSWQSVLRATWQFTDGIISRLNGPAH